MSHSKQVFTDPTGKRAKWMVGGLGLFLLVSSILLTTFILTLASNKSIYQEKAAPIVKSLFPERPKYTEPIAKKLNVQVAKDNLHKGPPRSVPITSRVSIGFYVPWEQASIDSLRENAAHLTHVSPAWFSLQKDGSLRTTDFDLKANPTNNEVINIAQRNSLKIVPLISNATEGDFNDIGLANLLKSPEKVDALIEQVIRLCHQNAFAGINLDFENYPEELKPAYELFAQKLYTRFKAEKLELSIDVAADQSASHLKSIGNSCDFVILMAYDEHEDTSDAGPIASLSWTKSTIQAALETLPPEKVVLGIGNYAYDWQIGKGHAESVGYQEAMLSAKGYRDGEKAIDVLKFDDESKNTFFEYEDESNTKHIIWILDAASAFNSYRLAQTNHLAGSALWSLGTEDPGIWSFWNKDLPDATQFQRSGFGFEVDFEGKGEFLSLLSESTRGSRKLSVDPKSGFITSQSYETYATPTILKKSGFKPGKIVLTFDDGPDLTFTKPILDILKAKKCPATFFCIGSNIEAYPGLAQSIYSDGHEIGNHSYFHANLGTVSKERSQLEIEATQRVIEATIGVSTQLFRPPYNADSQPETESQVRPVVQAAGLGLITVGENVDPNDWDPTVVDARGNRRPRTSEDIVQLVLDDLAKKKETKEEGNIVLLHDAGGNRDATVKALPILIDKLRERGYELVSASSLIGKTRDDVMPPIPASKKVGLFVDRIVFGANHYLSAGLAISFLLAIGLGVFRTALMLFLAEVHRRQPKPVANPNFQPTVSVLIAAYNESKTISSTIRSVLHSTYPLAEIIVIDDGSTDETGKVVSQEFAGNSTVKSITQPNGGKASALNNGIASATGELIFCIDADTELSPDAIQTLIPYFQNERVGAVAGGVEVGNVHNLLTIWQSIEYRTSQNMDRRAYASVNGITVIPGAIGLWRKSSVQEVGGYDSTTLAEDMDLTWKIRRAGYILETDARAKAFTEAPDRWRTLFKQRSRWAHGTLQCLWKHRGAIGKHGWFGWVILPLQWVFQVFVQLLGPLVDLQILISVISLLIALSQKSLEVSADQTMNHLWFLVGMYALFFAMELASGLWACWVERRRPYDLGWLLLQRFAYRQLMYVVILKAIWSAVIGKRQSWGSLHRTGKAIGSSTQK